MNGAIARANQVTDQSFQSLPPGSQGSPHSSALLELDHVNASYGPYKALFDVSFKVPEGSAVALLGTNGAGKSTVARVISGLVPVESGSVVFGGREITGLPVWKIARAGVAHAPEGRSIFASLTVEENLMLGFALRVGESSPSKSVKEALEKAYAAFPRLGERRRQLAGTLSGGEQRMLSLAGILTIPPKLLIVDELSLGLAPVVVDEVFDTLERILEEGTTMLVIEQHIGRALEIADSVVVLSKGRVVHDGPVRDLEEIVQEIMPRPEE
ncbi:MAG: ABC transporter ATP-binding protein [Actinobacteria bacterium]|nr:ABC transporter ATP-binding protein [Actinomycetota bacterium]MCL6094493.1 ABC transporter ATP-binding protein [Actinomycetota bacterium]